MMTVLLAAALSATLIVQAPYPERHRISSRDTTYAVARGAELGVNKASGRITIRVWDKQAVRVRVIGPVAAPYELMIGGEGMSIRSQPAKVGEAPSEYEITVPRAQELGIASVSAAIVIDGTRGMVRATALDGNISARNISGATKLESLNGTVSVRLSSAPLLIYAPNRHVVLDSVRGDIKVRSVNGDITVDHAILEGMDLQSYSGTIRVAGELRVGKHTVKTFSGNITIAPPSAGASIAARATKGKVVVPSDARANGMAVTVGDGGVSISAESFRGDITILWSRTK